LAYYQVDNTYARNIESLVRKVCALSHQQGEEHRLLRAASLQCLSAMVMNILLFTFFTPHSPFFTPMMVSSNFVWKFNSTDYHNICTDLVHEGSFIHIC